MRSPRGVAFFRSFYRGARRTFIAFFFENLAIWAPICFYIDSEASTEEVHMKIHSMNRQMPKVCADAAEDHRTLLS